VPAAKFEAISPRFESTNVGEKEAKFLFMYSSTAQHNQNIAVAPANNQPRVMMQQFCQAGPPGLHEICGACWHVHSDAPPPSPCARLANGINQNP